VLACFRYASLASVAGAVAAPVAAVYLGYPAPILTVVFLMTAIITLRHRDNFTRLKAGTEPRFVLPKK
jgi:glycerol-3-phosphate acyltransferase PlsY